MKRILFLALLCFLPFSFANASEVTGSIDTSGLSTGLQFSLPCNPASVTNGSVNSTTCVITCNSGYNLSGSSCVAPAASGGGGGGGGGGGSSIIVTTTSTGTTSSGSTTTSGGSSTTSPTTTTVSSGSTSSSLVTLPPVILTTSSLVFGDIASNWAKTYVQKLAVRGIVTNSTKFRPDSNLTRAEFLKIIGNTAGWKMDSTATSFRDVSATDWYAKYVAYAVSHSIISEGTSFRPNDPITRAEVAKILMGTLGKSPSSVKTSSFADVPASSSLMGYIEAAKENGIFEGQLINGKRFFRPGDPITRAEISKVVVLAMGL